MNVRVKLILIFVTIFTVIFALSLAFVYFSFSAEREREFFERLRLKAITSGKLLADQPQRSKDLLNIIDDHTSAQLFDEVLLIFDENRNVLHSSAVDRAIPFSPQILDRIVSEKEVQYREENDAETVGIFFSDGNHRYIILCSGYDRYGNETLRTTFIRLISVLLFAVGLISIAGMLYIKKVFQPVQELNQSIRSLTIANLNQYIPVKEQSDELGEIARNYNAMLRRLYTAVESQKAFVHNASHELKTPLARIAARIDNLTTSGDAIHPKDLESIGNDIAMLSEMVESLLLLHQLQGNKAFVLTNSRLDELLYACLEEIKSIAPHFHFQVDIDLSISDENQLIISGNPLLIRICMINLLRNAVRYSSNQNADIQLKSDHDALMITFSNSGSHALDPERIFEPFYRGENARQIDGTGLGLSIVKRIASVMNADIDYAFHSNTHLFKLTFRKFF